MNIGDTFTWEGEVRDHEIDFQGRVNNIYYLVYMEHARYKHCKLLGIDVRATRIHNFNFVLAHIEIDFKAPLMGGDEFIVTSELEQVRRVRIIFRQKIIRKCDKKMVAEAKIVIVCVDHISGRPIMPEQLKSILKLK